MFNRIISSFLFLTAVNTGIVQAQVVPDGTLPTVVEQLENMRKITGGERVGNNLFHSFEEFSIPEGIEAIFENGLDIENIFTRITGSDISVIDGLLKTAGGANFFLINPNGIVFGENAVLDIGGSFIATTANRIEFADGTNWNARGDEPKVTLTISVPIGLRLDGDNGSITVNSSGNQITPSFSSTPTQVADNELKLSVNPGQTLGLIGNSISVEGGTITSKGGSIELGSISSGSVSLQNTEGRFKFNYENANGYQNIDLTNLSVLDVSGEGRGAISLTGKNINLSNGSLVLNQNQGDISSETIDINASDSLNLLGTSPDGNVSSAIRAEVVNSGKGADINISTAQIVLQDGGRIGSTTYQNENGQSGDAGNLSINSTDSVQLLENTGLESTRPTFLSSSIASTTYSDGNAGSLELSTSELQVTSGGSVTSTTLGSGQGGDVNITSDIVEVRGVEPIRNTPSGIISGSVNTGNAGNLTITTGQLKVADGATVSTSSFASGNSGNLTINSSQSVELDGEQNIYPTTIRSAVIPLSIETERIRLGLPDVPTGNAGSLTLNTPVLSISQEGAISVENQGIGSAGTLTINAEMEAILQLIAVVILSRRIQ
ncbi:MAG: filamentous hemagglutinin N-terminal domain-containing protein [Xenococcaceae cyanobacterium]